MFHLFNGQVKKIYTETYIINSLFGIQVSYGGVKAEGEFYIYPYFDDQKKTIIYFAFDTYAQKLNFEKMLKISGVGPKIAFQIVQIPSSELEYAVENLDTKIFQPVAGIGPKLAKKIILELKGSFHLSEIENVEQDQKLFKSVVKSLKNLGYDPSRVKEILKDYPEKLSDDNLPIVVKWVISQLN